MAQLPERTLSWLWSVVQTYAQPRLVYNDAVAALSRTTSLQAKTGVYSHETGQSALLLCLYGSIPVDFRGKLYKYPVEIWLLQEYGQPGVPPIAYVKPDGARQGAEQNIVVRPGQHVGVDGRIYHPYLRDWGQYERSSVTSLVQVMQSIFAKEPPIVSRSQPPQTPSVPALPPKQRAGETTRTASGSDTQSGAPPLPAKPGRPVSNLVTNGPTHAGHIQQSSYTSTPHGDYASTPKPDAHSDNLRSSQQRPPPLPPLPTGVDVASTSGQRRPVSPMLPADQPSSWRHNGNLFIQQQMKPSNGTVATPLRYHQQNSTIPQSPSRTAPHPQLPQQLQPRQSPQYPQQYQPQYQHRAAISPADAPRQPKQAIDLLTDPFDVSLAPTQPAGPAPPIPPNPEKEHLLRALSDALVSRTHVKIHQAQSAMAPLMAQRQALLEAHSRLQGEIHQLQALETVLTTNENILHQNIRDCQSVIEKSRSMPRPNVDEVLVAPTVAAQQLWNLCAEEAAIKEALWCLQRAVDVGRVGGPEFVRLTRSLARECFLKMALAKKVASGLGLDVQVPHRAR